MNWRQLPPVLSPVSPLGLLRGLGGAIGLEPNAHERARSALRQRFDATDALLTDSGTSALVLALRAVAKAGAVVAYPAYACVDITAAAVRAGVRIRLYDLDPQTLNPDLDSLAATIKRGVDAIVAVHLYGYPVDVDAMREVADARGIPVIEDAAQGANGTLRGKRLGALGTISTLSFGRGKGLAAGSGGAVLVRTPQLSDWGNNARRELGVAARGGGEVVSLAAQWMLGRPLLYRVPASLPGLKLGEMVYRPAHEPRAMRAAAAAMIPTALALGDAEIESRRSRARDLLALMSESPRLRAVRPIPEGRPGYLRLAFLDMAGSATPLKALGAIRGYPMTLDQHAALKPILMPGEKAGQGALMLRDRLFTVPTHSRVGDRDAERIASWSS